MTAAMRVEPIGAPRCCSGDIGIGGQLPIRRCPQPCGELLDSEISPIYLARRCRRSTPGPQPVARAFSVVVLSMPEVSVGAQHARGLCRSSWYLQKAHNTEVIAIHIFGCSHSTSWPPSSDSSHRTALMP